MRQFSFLHIFPLLLIFASCVTPQSRKSTADSFAITTRFNPDLFGTIEIVLENDHYRAQLKTNGPHHREKGFEEGYYYWHGIRNWEYKKYGIDQAIGAGIDLNHFRGNCYKTEMLEDGTDTKTIRLYYHTYKRFILAEADIDTITNKLISEYTIFRNSPVIKIRYVSYAESSGWSNIFDIGSPGGLEGQYMAKTKVYGQEKLGHDLIYHEKALWQGYQISYDEVLKDDSTGAPLIYKGHFIMAVANPKNGIGFGRVMPKYEKGKTGGVKILKLLWDQGFEVFPSMAKEVASDTPPFIGYIYPFEGGLDAGIAIGKSIVDGQPLHDRVK